MANKSLSQAKDAKNDEFYTQLSEIQAEIANYAGNVATGETNKFENKVVFCNCDDPFESNFVKYFLMNFNRLKLKELIATGYKTSPIGGTDIGSKGEPYALRVTSTTKYLVGTQKDLDIKGAKYFLSVEGDRVMTPLIGNPAIDEDGKAIVEEIKEPVVDTDGNPVVDKKGNPKYKKVKHDVYYEAGDFRSDMCIELLKQSDIVCTNPPFSLFREYIAILMKYEKQFLIIGNKNAITYKEFFPLLKNNKVWIGNCIPNEFILPDGTITKKVQGLTRWFTNLDHAKRHITLPLDLGFTYYEHEDMYPKYDNYDAINVDKVSEIPCDYEPCWYKCPHASSCKYAQTEGKEDKTLCEQSCNGEIGVPISFMDKHCPEQFEILGNAGSYSGDGSVANEVFITPQQNDTTHTHTRRRKVFKRVIVRRCHKCNGIIGVPISFLDKYCPEQFGIIGLVAGNIRGLAGINSRIEKDGPYIDGKLRYGRIFVQKV